MVICMNRMTKGWIGINILLFSLLGWGFYDTFIVKEADLFWFFASIVILLLFNYERYCAYENLNVR